MSHSKERHEKVCLNCNAELTGRYCHVCGQENIEPKETVWGLVSHFFYDITHFDGKFFSTTRYLITRPGFLPKEYIKGRRASYLHPIRMYVFSSALFFLIFFSLFKADTFVNNTKKAVNNTKEAQAKAPKDSTQNAEDSIDSREDSIERREDSIENRKDSIRDARRDKKVKSKINWSEVSSHFKTVEEYDSAQKAMPEDKRDGWWARKAAHRNIELAARYRDDETRFWKDLVDKFMHTFPYLLFISLPLYAFFMKLLYWRHKQFYYVDHGIFFIYLYIFTFIFLLVYFSIVELRQYTGWGFIGWLEAILFLVGIYYTYKAMRKFYGQGRAMTLLKFFLLNIMAFFSIIILFAIFLTLTVFRL